MSIKSKKSPEAPAPKPSSDNSLEAEPVASVSPKSAKPVKDRNEQENADNVLAKSSPTTAFLQDDNAMFPDTPLSDLVTPTPSSENTDNSVKLEDSDADSADKNSGEEKSDVVDVDEDKTSAEVASDVETDVKETACKSDAIVQVAGEGFTVKNAKNVTLAELLLMFGTLSDGHVKLEYEWIEAVNIDVKLSQLANMLRRLSHIATMEFCEVTRSKTVRY